MNLQDYRKVIMRHTVHILTNGFDFFRVLPGHKADRFFEGSRVVFQESNSPDDACRPFKASNFTLHSAIAFSLTARNFGFVLMRRFYPNSTMVPF
jgi:hypothetical protein